MHLRSFLPQSKIRETKVAICIETVQNHLFQSQDYISKYSLNLVLHEYILKLIFFHHRIPYNFLHGTLSHFQKSETQEVTWHKTAQP